MAKSIRSQSYPRIQSEDDRFYGYLDITVLKEHSDKIEISAFKKIINDAIKYAHTKSSREILSISPGWSNDELDIIYKKKGKELFDYFVKYCGDPASTAYDCLNKSYAQIAKENFRNRTIQKERMNAGWRYQYIAKDAARLSHRFDNVSDLNAIEADFNVVIQVKNTSDKLNIYVSVKNRSNTMGGQDWPKAIAALENAAINDKNRSGHYICVFGIAMEKAYDADSTQDIGWADVNDWMVYKINVNSSGLSFALCCLSAALSPRDLFFRLWISQPAPLPGLPALTSY